jgi:alpha-glucuronidase
MPAPTPTLAAARDELARGLRGLLGDDVRFCDAAADATLIVGTPAGALGLDNGAIDDECAAVRAVLDDDRRFVIGTVPVAGARRS